ncbi:MAG: hypothetical protein AABY15_01040 [Nanoarchaeota archaeon]
MGWKNWPTWLKGGIIGAIIALILGILIKLLEGTGFGLLIAVLFLILSFSGLGNCDFEGCYPYNFYFLTTPFVLLEFFIIGAIIGWIISKINKK